MSNNNNNNTNNNNSNNNNNNNNNNIDTLRAELKEVKEKLLKAEGELDTVNNEITPLRLQLATEGDASEKRNVLELLKIYYQREGGIREQIGGININIAALTNRLTALENQQSQRGTCISFLQVFSASSRLSSCIRPSFV